MIFNTNVLIYLLKNILNPDKVLSQTASISVITKIELTDLVAVETIQAKAMHRIKLPDAIIYSIALVLNMPLLTNNIADFKSLGNKVELINPFTL